MFTKRIKKLSNKQIIFIAILCIIIGIGVIGSDYFMSKKDKVYEKMSYELSGIPEIIETEEIVPDEELNEAPEVITEIEETGSSTQVSTNTNITYNYIGYLEIPGINLKKGFVAMDSFDNNVNKNIAIMEESSYPNVENSVLVFAAHNGSCWNCYFRNLNKLVNGDTINVYYDGIKYIYKLVNTYVVDKTGSVTIYRNPNKTSLALVTCTWNTKNKQTVFVAELINKENM